MIMRDMVLTEARKCADDAYAQDPNKIEVADPMSGDWDHYDEIVDDAGSGELEDLFRETYRDRLEARINGEVE